MKCAPVLTLLAATAALTACHADRSDRLTLEEAAQLVVDELALEGTDSIAFAHPQRLGGHHELRAHRPASPRIDDPPPLDIREDSWFIWVDDDPGALFDHPNRFVLVGADSGEITVLDESWWPVLDGESLWDTRDEYWSGADWVYAPADAGFRTAAWGAPPRVASDEVTCSGVRGKALVINGWQEGDTMPEVFEEDAQNMKAHYEGFGFETTYFGPAGSAGTDARVNGSNLESWFGSEGASLKPGETLVVFVTGHGMDLKPEGATQGTGFVGGVWEDDLAKWLGQVDPGVEIIVVINGCHGGSFVDGLACVADLTLTATDAEKSSYSDLDFEGDPNPNDKGSEWVSGLSAGLLDEVGSPAAHREVLDHASTHGIGFWEAAHARAAEEAKALDIAAQRGWTAPQTGHGKDETKPEPPRTQAPSCEPGMPGPSEEPSGCGDGMEELGKALEILLGDASAAGSACDGSEMTEMGNAIWHSDGIDEIPAAAECDLLFVGVSSCDVGVCDQNLDAFGCGESDLGLTLCRDDHPGYAEDEYLLLYDVFDAEIPLQSDLFHQYGFVFEVDGDAGTDYQPNAAWPKDFYGGTDVWYSIEYQPGVGWIAPNMVDARNGEFSTWITDAKTIITGNTLILAVPRRELGFGSLSYRTTAFAHDGSYGLEGGHAIGDTVPTVDAGTRPIP